MNLTKDLLLELWQRQLPVTTHIFATGAGGMLQTVIFWLWRPSFNRRWNYPKEPYSTQAMEKKLTITGVGPNKKTYVIE